MPLLTVLLGNWRVLLLGVLVAAVAVQTHRLSTERERTAEITAAFSAFKAEVTAAGTAAQERNRQQVAAANSNAKQAGRTYEANLARVSEYYLGRLRDSADSPGSGGMPAASTDPGSADGNAKELAACRASLGSVKTLEGACAADALTLYSLQELLRRNGHPVK